mmetsp:Transcript_16720/g.35488  ORF Transcript_16720/g.35488 Transcript_16720/m.35488 type:complete len:907 (-) Transcript_16720:136-2856(-)
MLAAGAAAAAGGTLFEYNRKNYMYDRNMRQETEYQIMDFRIKQADLWREDVRDIIGLTSVKMDTYLIVNAVQLGFCVMAFCEGRLASGTPTWLIGCHTLSLAGAFMYLLMSVWLAMHASVTAKSYEVRLLTQHVRLPMPTWTQLEGSRTYASTFEKTDPKQMFRVPFAMGTQESVLQHSSRPASSSAEGGASRSSDAPPLGVGADRAPPGQPGASAEAATAGASAGEAVESADLWGLEARGDGIYELDGSVRADPTMLRHLSLVKEALQYWQSYDGFARVAMSMGTNQLVTALAYYVLGYVLISNHAVVAAWLVVLLFMAILAALIRLDMSLTTFEYRVAVILVISGPVLMAVACEQWTRHTARLGPWVWLTPIAFAMHALWLTFLLYISKVSEQQGGAYLPTGFRSVMYIDVFGWIKRHQAQLQQRRMAGQPAPRAGADARVSGSGPAVQAVRYERGHPVPTRPESLPGASQSIQAEGVRREDFEPTTFVPRELKSTRGSGRTEASSANTGQNYLRPGFVPWRIFCAATSFLIVLWWIVGFFVLLQASGNDILKVQPLLREVEDLPWAEAEEPLESIVAHKHNVSSLLQFRSTLLDGKPMSTTWPQSRIQPHGLACSDEAGHMLVSSSRFGLFMTQLSSETSEEGVKFSAAPACDALEGESLRDVTLSCNEAKSPGECRALVLHRQGQRLSACALKESAGGKVSEAMPAVMRLSDTWLGSGSATEAQPQEEVTSIALAQGCSGGGQCAYVETSDRRIVEVKAAIASGEKSGEPDWFPTHMVLDHVGGQAALPGGSLHLIAGRYLGVLQPKLQRLEVLDLKNGTLVGSWDMPGSERWSAMCSMGSSLYFLTEGNAPQLWHFPLPPELRPEEEKLEPTPRLRASQSGARRGGPSAPGRRLHASLTPA